MKTIAIMSGGMDSTTLVYDLVNQGDDVKLLSFNYGQRHSKELDFARITAKKLNLAHKVVDITSINQLLLGNALTSDSVAVPLGHYAEMSVKQTVVPNRNMIMLALATGYAVSEEYDRVAFAAHGGDHTIYPDCRKEFVEALSEVTKIANWHPVSIYAPYLEGGKEDIASTGDELGVPWEDTWSCYEGLDIHCGGCGTCVERKEAFDLADIEDTTKYENNQV